MTSAVRTVLPLNHPADPLECSQHTARPCEAGRRFRCTMRIDCSQINPGAVIRPIPGEWRPHIPERLNDQELANWRAGRSAAYQFAAVTIGARLAVANA